MATTNFANKEINCKIVYYGPGLCGKTTNLQYIFSKIGNNSKGKLISLATETDRTLFFDFMPLNLGKIRGFNVRFHLYTVPGQVYYNASRKLVLKGLDGVVFVADSQESRFDANIESLENLKENLSSHNFNLEQVPFVIQYNKQDLSNLSPISEMEQTLNYLKVPSFKSVAINGKGVFDTLKMISYLVLKKLKNQTS